MRQMNQEFLDFNWIVPLKIVSVFGYLLRINFPSIMSGNMQTREVLVDYSLVCTSYW